MTDSEKSISDTQATYYGNLYARFGPGVDAVASGRMTYKNLRYGKLCRVFQGDESFSLHDVGFGLAHLLEYLRKEYPEKKITYSGSEVTAEFVNHCSTAYSDCCFYNRDLADRSFEDRYDYLVFGGTFYHTVGMPQERYAEYVRKMLKNAFPMARKGIAFNFVTSHVDYRYEDLFYADPGEMVEFCVRNLSRFLLIDHSYPLYEYTMCVFREEHVASQYAHDDFQKYLRSASRRRADG